MTTTEGNASRKCYEVNLSVKYPQPIPFGEATGKAMLAAGYIRKYLVVAISEDQLRQTISGEVRDGEIDWADSEIKQLGAAELAEYSLNSNSLPSPPSVVLRSSHFLFPSKSEER